MITFIISFLLVFVSSYLLTSVLAQGNALKGFIYLNLIAFGQIIVISEVLSIFTKIQPLPFLLLNILFTTIILLVWYKFDKPILKPDTNKFLKKVIYSCKLDPSLLLLFIAWGLFIFVSVILIILLPPTSGDALAYHVSRSIDWVINRSMAHFETADIRCIAFPINSEILYMWVILFTKKLFSLGAFSFAGYILFITSTFGIFKYICYSMRRTLWTLLIVSSFASVISMTSGTETDLIIAGLITSSVYLFINAVKNNSDNITLFMSSLAYSIAIGVKTPAIIAIPSVALLYIIISHKHKDKYSLLKFILFGIFNFIIFSSYNYILNYTHFGNFMGNEASIAPHKNLFGIAGFLANFIRHLFLMIDFTGLQTPAKYTQILFNTENNILQLLNLNTIPAGLNAGKFYFNTSLSEMGMGCGILSFLLILPCWIISLFAPIFNKCRIFKIQNLFAFLFLINLIFLSSILAFMTFNTRFITSYILISAPMLACSYIKSNRNIIKYVIVIIAVSYFTLLPTHFRKRPFFKVLDSVIHEGLNRTRTDVRCSTFNNKITDISDWCNINGLIESKYNDKNYKILYVPSVAQEIAFTKMRKLQGQKYDFINAEHLKNINIDKYYIIVFPEGAQKTYYFDKYTPDKIDYYLQMVNDNEIDYYTLNDKDEIACCYFSVYNVMSKQIGNENEKPIKKSCKLTNEFFKKHPFKIVYKTKDYFIMFNINKFPEFD